MTKRWTGCCCSRRPRPPRWHLDRAFDLIAAFPLSMQPYPSAKQRDAEYRCIDVKNYLAFYVVLGDTVEFRRFLPSRADLPSHLAD